MTDKRYRIELEVITPLHVGTGSENDWVRGADYAQNGKGKVYIIDIRKAVEKKIGIVDLFMASINNNNGIESLDDKRLESISKYIFNSPESTNNDIKSCLRNQFLDTPVVAGSSIKGAIRSALFKHLAEGDLSKERGKNQNDKQLVKTIFGDMNKGTDFMRFIRISDIEIPNDNHSSTNPGTILVNTKLFNLQNNNSDNEWQGGWKNGQGETTTIFQSDKFNTLYECIEPGKKGVGVIVLAGSGLELLNKKTDKISYAEEKNRLVGGEINELFKIINKATREYLEEEEVFFSRYDEAAYTSDIIDSIRELRALIPNEETDTGSNCLLKMSAGVGYHAITGNWIYDDFINTGTNNGKPDGKKNKKSRKIALYKGKDEKPYLTGFELMGFVKLRIITGRDIEYDKLLNDANILLKDGKWKDAYKKVQEAERKCPTRREHIGILEQCEKFQRDETRKTEEQQKLNAYNECISEARALMNERKWEEAKQKAELAKEIDIKRSEHHKIIEGCDKAIKFRKPLSDLIRSGMSLGNVIGTTKTWKSYHTFGENEYIIFKEALNGIKEKELKKKQGELSKVIGELLTNRLLEELFPQKTVEAKNDIVEIEEIDIVKTDSTREITDTEKEKIQPIEVPVDNSQRESKEDVGFLSKILKLFKKLF